MSRWDNIKERWSYCWADLVIYGVIALMFAAFLIALPIAVMSSIDKERACSECIEMYCTGDDIDGCDCAQCIVLCR